MTKQHILKPILLLLFILIFTGCSSKLNLFVKSFVQPIPYSTIVLEDGTKTLYYEIEKKSAHKSNAIIFFITGSGYASLQYYLKPYFENLDLNTKIYALQKRNISNRTTGIFEKPKRFDKENIFDNWVKDNAYFIHKIISKEENRDKEIILFGVSEGATVAAKVATLVPRVTHLVILGSGGLPQSQELKILHPKYKEQFTKIFADICKHPNSTKKDFMAHPYIYWSHILFENPMEYYAKINIPILLAIGEKDKSAPVESARFLRDAFRKLKKSNLKYIEYKNCDHILTDNHQVNHKKAFFKAMVDWYDGTKILK